MDPNKFYCRNAATTSIHSTASQSSVSSASSATAASVRRGDGVCSGGAILQHDYGSSMSGVGNCRELVQKKSSQLHHRGTNTGVCSLGNNTSNLTTSGQSVNVVGGGGNYLNIVPVPIGMQYHRRKITPQEYQSRLYYNNTDYRCRDDYYAAGTTSRLSATSPSPSPSLQLQQQHQHHQHQQHQQQQQQQQHASHHQHYHQQQQQQQQQQHHHQQHQHHPHQTQQTHHLNQFHHHHQQHNQPTHLHPHQHHHQSIGATDCVDDVLKCVGTGGSSSIRVNVAATQTPNGNDNCEQLMAAAPASSALSSTSLSSPCSLGIGGMGVGMGLGVGVSVGVGSGGGVGTANKTSLPPGPPVLYTVHRVVTTAQIQTAGGNTFASSSSVSSVVSAVRNEAECLAVVNGLNGVSIGSGNVSLLGSNSNGNSGVGAGSSIVGGFGSISGGGTVAGGLRSSPGISTNSNYQPHQQQCSSNSTLEAQQASFSSRISNNNYNSTTSSLNTNYSSGAKSSSSIPRPLQNVIPTCVYLMSRIAVHMEIEGTAQCPSQVMLAAALGCEELGIANKLLAQSIFGLWMTSALLEIQLKSHHRPYVVRIAWQNLLEKFSHGNPVEKKFDEPMIMLKRNVFFSKKDEEKIKDHRILELLYEEAKYNVLTGRYIMEPAHSIMLGGIQARIELGPYNTHTHTISFFRENQSRFLPQHVAKNSSWSWLPVSRKNSAEVKLLEQYKRVPQTATTRKLMRKYLEFCWALPFYGAAFFHGQVEQPVRGLMSLVNHKDVSVIIAINERGIFIIDPVECTLILGLRYEDLSWDFAKPSANDDLECQTCIFIQFDAVENGVQMSKLMQIFSRQAAMMDALIAHFADQMRRRKESIDGNVNEQMHDEPNPIQNNGNGVLCNKLSRLTLATFDDEGRCIGQMGSLSISY